jgi:signal transduction histidine kinase/DNA-binding response OmpR family regulator
MKNLPCRVLLVEDSESDYLIVSDFLSDIVTTEFNLQWVDNYRDAREAIMQNGYDVCLLDYRLGEATGVDLVREFASVGIPFILLTGMEDFKVDLEAAAAGSADFLVKGHINAPLLERSIRYAIERKKTEAALLHAQNFAQATVDSLGSFIAVLDEQGTIVTVNAAWRERVEQNSFTGWDSGIGSDYLKVCDDEGAADAAQAAAGIRAVISGERKAFALEYECHSPQQECWFRMSVTRFLGGGLPYIVVAHENITERKQSECALRRLHEELEARVLERTAELGAANELLSIENVQHQLTMGTLRQVAEAYRQAKDEADRANNAKSEFLSRMSHELRTPLNAILGFGQILELQGLGPRAQESIDYILQGGRHLLDLINEVLDIASVEAGRLDLAIEPMALGEVVPEACALVSPLADKHGIRLEDASSEFGNEYVLADRQRFKQVMINLLGNAIKYNRAGGRVEVSSARVMEGWLSLTVRDTGQGISPENLAKLFVPFERLDAAISRVEGTGLGLVLSKRLVEAMGGRLSVQSTLGVGTAFTIELPRATVVGEPMDPKGSTANHAILYDPALKTYDVLCIEDNLSNLRLMKVLFENRPQIVMSSSQLGREGLHMARLHPPDLILLDLDLPDIHGSEVLKELQQSAFTRDIPVVMVSADATPPQIQRMLAAGASEYLTKPIVISEFLAMLDRFLGAKFSG